MASSLKLMLERHISANRVSSALELPLDRKLGELSRLTYVYADALPLRLERRISEQPPANALYLALSQPLGTLAPPQFVTSDRLTLPLDVPISEQPPSNRLPLGLTRKLGTLVGVPVVLPVDPEPPIDPEEPEEPTEPTLPPAPPIGGVANCYSSVVSSAKSLQSCRDWHHNGLGVNGDLVVNRDAVITLANCHALKLRAFTPLANCSSVKIGEVIGLSDCLRNYYVPFIPIHNTVTTGTNGTIGYSVCKSVFSAPVKAYRHCVKPQLDSVIEFSDCVDYQRSSVDVGKCQHVKVSEAIPVPDRYYSIPEPPPEPPDYGACKIRPPSSQLPLRMSRRRGGLLSSHLPLTMTCWHDEPPLPIPNLRTYIVHNVITATVGGIAVDLMSFSIKTDVNSYCWSGDITISARDFDKIKHKLDVPRGQEPMINVNINGFVFSIIAEEQQRSRQFANHTHSLSGRSVTARLGADYAVSQGGIIELASYASQIANAQLNGLPITIADWQIADWLIPARQYSVTNKTPIAVIADIAKAAGGFVVSDASQPTLALKKRWRVNAWELATATPDVIIPVDIIRQISDQRRVNPRYNTVSLLSGVERFDIFRQLQSRDADAPAQDSPLYTDRDVAIPAGAAILSDSGIHGDYILKMRWGAKYNIPLAEPGQIWQINDPEGAWRGIVTAVSVNIELDDGAPTIWQTVGIDRYLDA